MKIYGPYTRKDGRKHIIKYENGKRTTQSYPRYLMEQKLGRALLNTEEVDHKDNDFTNNDIQNLQILTKANNILKHKQYAGIVAKIWEGFCPVCGIEFSKRMKDVRGNRKKNKAGPFCSRSCAGKYSASNQYA